MPGRIRISDFLKAETVEFVEKVITDFCSRKNLSYTPLEPDYNFLFTISIERCNLEYSGKGKYTHFQSGIRSYLEVHDEHLFLMLTPDNKASEAVKDVALDLTVFQGLQGSAIKEYQTWLIEDIIIGAMQLDEDGLEKFKRPQI